MNITLQPSGFKLDVRPGERILEAAHRLGYECPHGCRDSACHVCAALLVEGRVRQNGVEMNQGEIFTCLAEPLEDCLVHWDGVLASSVLPVRELTCQLIECQAVGGDVYRVRLLAPEGEMPLYHAGQYLLLQRETGEFSAFSLASAPHQGRELELHVFARDGSSKGLPGYLDREGTARIRLPFGDAHLAELPDGPLVLLAAGTGMAQMHSLIEHCRARGFTPPIHLYWGVRRAEDFYEISHWADWQKLPGLSLHKIVSDGWEGRGGLLYQAIREDFTDLKGLHIYASGSPTMVYATLDALVEAGMDAHQMRADVFDYAPRS